MSSIYVSSTYADLEKYRLIVIGTLRRMEHRVICMEDYGAADQRPLRKCLRDVEECQVYVGLFAWRYGFVPTDDNPAGRSITELEYRHARELGKTCLIFMLHEEAPWPRTRMDTGADAERIAALRGELERNHLIVFFKTESDLAAHVVTAVHNWAVDREGQRGGADRVRYVSSQPPPARQASGLQRGGWDKSIRIWNVNTGRQERAPSPETASISTLLDLRRTTVADTTLYDPPSSQRERVFREIDEWHGGMPPQMARSALRARDQAAGSRGPASPNYSLLAAVVAAAVAAAALAAAVAWALLGSKTVLPAPPPPSLRGGSSLLPWVPARRAIEAAILFALAATPQRQGDDTPITDIVDVSAFAPEGGQAGDEALVQIFLHRLRDAAAAEARARAADHRATRRGVATLASAIARGTRVDILLEATDLKIDEPLQSLVWEGRPCACQFIVTLPAGAGNGPRALRARVLLNGAPIGRLCFSIEILSTTDGTARPIGIRGDRAQRYRQAFLSYARQDRVEVVKRAQALRAVGVNFFQDILSIEPGEQWEARLYHEIDTCDLFLLFWSSHAARSEWVLREAQYAMDRQKLSPGGEVPDITPVILEGPPIPPPPDSLRHLHFNDYLRYFIVGAESESRPRPNRAA
mgnify:CR=1 FL=1